MGVSEPPGPKAGPVFTGRFGPFVVGADAELSELAAAEGPVEVVVRRRRRLGAVVWDDPPTGPDTVASGTLGGRHVLRVPDTVDFVIGRDEVGYVEHGDLPPGELSHQVVSTALPYVVGLWGYVAVHGTAVAVDGRAVGFLGATGTGKSTMAVAMGLRGHAVLADDCLILDPQSSRLIPSYPETRIEAATLAGLLGREGEPASRGEDVSKTRVGPRGGIVGFDSEPHRLAALLVLDRTGSVAPTLRLLPPTEGFVKLLEHAFVLERRGQGPSAEVLERVGAILERTPVLTLTYPGGLEHLPAVVELVLDRLRVLGGGAT